MTMRAKFDDMGRVTGFYPADLFPEPPSGTIEIEDSDHQRLLDSPDGWRWDGMTLVSHEPPSAPVDLVAYTAQKRWETEVGGIVVNGLIVATDDRSKIMISGARVAAQSNPEFTTDWKSQDGTFVTIDAAAVVAISDAILAHVSGCFSIEAAIIADIMAGVITAPAEIDAVFLNGLSQGTDE
ncbi:DUF4376 domain-containing protein [Phyllobacterium phragmitis]|nr:DUF4376 domain-containing protein [Phyllobacterium phragmitis]